MEILTTLQWKLKDNISSDELYKLIGQIEVEGHNNLNRWQPETGMALGEQNGMDYASSCLHLWLQGNDEMLSYEQWSKNCYRIRMEILTPHYNGNTTRPRHNKPNRRKKLQPTI